MQYARPVQLRATDLNQTCAAYVGRITPAAVILTAMLCRKGGPKLRWPSADNCSESAPLPRGVIRLIPRLNMPPNLAELQTTGDLHAYVHEVLCRKENLMAEMFVTRVSTLRRGCAVCGLQFELQGPRCVKLSAVWAADQNVVYFYDTRGQRYRKVRLPQRLARESEAA